MMHIVALQFLPCDTEGEQGSIFESTQSGCQMEKIWAEESNAYVFIIKH